MAVGATRPAIRHRESCRRRRHCGRRGGRAFTTRWLHAPRLRFARRNQCDTQRQAQFRFSPRYRAGRGYRPWPACPGGAPIVSGQDNPRIYCLRESQSGQGQLWIGWHWHHGPHGPRTVQGHGGNHMVHVPYRGVAPALTDLIGGQVQAVFSTTPPAIEHIRAGKLRALAVTSAVRSEALPELPTIGDFLPGYEATFMVGLGGPKNVPAEIIDRLNREINAALAEPRIKARLADLGTVPLPMTSA